MRHTNAGFLRDWVEGVEAAIDLPFPGCSLPMREIYDGIQFTAVCIHEPELEYEVG